MFFFHTAVPPHHIPLREEYQQLQSLANLHAGLWVFINFLIYLFLIEEGKSLILIIIHQLVNAEDVLKAPECVRRELKTGCCTTFFLACTAPGGMLHPTVLWSQSKQTSRISGSPEQLQLLLDSQKRLRVTQCLKHKYMYLINGFSWYKKVW